MSETWIDIDDGDPFGPQTLPYGVAEMGVGQRRLVTRIGNQALDLVPVAASVAPDLLALLDVACLNPFMAAGPQAWQRVRRAIRSWVTDVPTRELVEPHLHPLDGLRLLLPFEVADYVDFYASRHHAENLGAIFRPGQSALTPNWLHLPIGYHGRAGTVVESGHEVVRPRGQRNTDGGPVFGPSTKLDIEAEIGFVVGVPSELGTSVSLEQFADHVFGVVLVNDWSARDLQSWEYVPLGPFLGKSFATTVSAWVTPLAAFESARVAPPQREVPLLTYLDDTDHPWGLNIDISIELNGEIISRPPFAQMYWTAAQQLAHMTANGASLRTGDLFASGTVSGPRPDERGSFIELSWNGERPLRLTDGSTRTFLLDGDQVVLLATGRSADGAPIGLGEVRGVIAPAVVDPG